MVHFEIESDDPKKTSKFYTDVFGWEFYQWGEEAYWLADTGSEPAPGIDGAVMKRKGPKTGVTNTVRVRSLDEHIKKVERAGGTICVPRMAIEGVGYLAYGTDLEGNLFGMMQMDRNAK